MILNQEQPDQEGWIATDKTDILVLLGSLASFVML